MPNPPETVFACDWERLDAERHRCRRCGRVWKFRRLARDVRCPDQTMGFGDRVARIIQIVTRGYIKECEGCKQRKRVLNNLGNSVSQVIARLHVKSPGGLGSTEPPVQVGLPPEKGIEIC